MTLTGGPVGRGGDGSRMGMSSVPLTGVLTTGGGGDLRFLSGTLFGAVSIFLLADDPFVSALVSVLPEAGMRPVGCTSAGSFCSPFYLIST